MNISTETNRQCVKLFLIRSDARTERVTSVDARRITRVFQRKNQSPTKVEVGIKDAKQLIRVPYFFLE